MQDCPRATDIWFSKSTLQAAGYAFAQDESSDEGSESDEDESESSASKDSTAAKPSAPSGSGKGGVGGSNSRRSLSTPALTSASSDTLKGNVIPAGMDPYIVQAAVMAVFGENARATVTNVNEMTSIKLDLADSDVPPSPENLTKFQNLLEFGSQMQVCTSDFVFKIE